MSEKQQPGVLVYRPVDESGASHRRLVDAGCKVAIADPGEDLDRALARLETVHALLGASLRGKRLDRGRIGVLPELRIIAKYTIGVDDIDVAAASDLGVLVTHCPTEANWGGVAEGTLGLMLALLKKIERRNAYVRAGSWRADTLRGTYIGARDDGYEGLTVGIIGLGRIGRRVAELLAPWKVRVIASDPYIAADVFDRHAVKSVELDELLARADLVSVHCQLTEETQWMIDASKIKLMKPGAILINTARGKIVDVDAVCDALDAGQLGGAAFDVLPEEPPPPGARILATDDRVILSPHMVAANRGGTLAAAIPLVTEAVLAALAGRMPRHVYNESAAEVWRSRFADKPLLTTQGP